MHKIVESLIGKHAGRSDLHITRVMGAFVAVSDGHILEIDRTHALQHCPLQSLLGERSIEKCVQEKMAECGHFSADREIQRRSLGVPFGTSEMFMHALRKQVLDCAVVVCDGAGTVITNNPDIVQGIGARMNGLFYTTPIPGVRDRLQQQGCIVAHNAEIDQIAGLRSAIAAGYRRIGMTVNACHGESLAEIRQSEKASGATVSIAAVCATGIDQKRAEEIAKHADLAWGCASMHMRDVGSHAMLQITVGIPIFAYTSRGIDVVAAYADEKGAEVLRDLDPRKQYLLSNAAKGQGIRLGERCLSISEVALPVVGKHAPFPLA